MTGGLTGKRGNVVIPLGAIDPLGRHEVRPRALPAARNGGAMEVYQQMMAGCALQQVDAVVHVQLVVA